MTTKHWLIYRAVNLINGKSYIGITGNPLGVRKSGHKQGAANASLHRSPFRNAIRKYGFDMFRFTVIKTVETKEEAMAEEIRLIATLRPNYNGTKGGNMPVTTPAGMEKIRAAAARLSEGRKKPVICLSDGKIFQSAVEAADHYSISCSMLCMVLKGRRATAAGRIFSFYTGTETPLSDPVQALGNIRIEQKEKMMSLTPRRAVICKNDNREFASVREAALAYGFPEACVSRIVRGVIAHQRGYVFIYKDDYLENDMAGKRISAVRGAYGYKKIRCATDGKIYISAMAADAEYGLYRGAASKSATLKVSVVGLSFEYMGEVL